MALIFDMELWSLLVLVIVTLCVILVVRGWLEIPQNIPPFPVRPLPIVGHIPHLTDPRRKLMEWRKTTGDLFSVYLGSTLVVVISSYDLLRETLVKQAEFFSERHHRGILPVLNVPEGVVGTSGEVWKENRSLTLNLLRSFGMGKHEMAENIIEEVSAYLGELSKLSGAPVYPKDLTSRSVSNVICRFLIGKRYEYDDPEYAKLLKCFEDGADLAKSSGLLHWFPNLKYLPGDPFSHKLLIKRFEEMTTFSEKLINDVIKRENTDCNEDNFIASYLEEMEKRQASGKPTHLRRNHLDRAIADLLTAGTESTTTTLLWFYLYMVHYPNIQEKIDDEIDRETGRSRLPCVADRTKMNFLTATIMEVQRISNVLPLALLHRVSEQVTVRGYTIPKDTMVIPHTDAVHFDEKIWGDPHNFRPERFLNDKGEVIQPEHFLAFSLGRRMCVGEAIARMELFLFLAMTLQRFKITPVDPDQLPPLTDTMGLTYPPTAFEVKFVERH
ncbi:cytochrome P450 2U1 [Elysia marginata]|uniref:Cytochrome P450 2U1 n=1 Tax=Elysia marginata TaxID=1093978 RepID=A0AAV4FWK5_9GAST|nr:cytochrome P450 2U1 [Elysia marginata]